jgi:DSF synthase
MITSGQTYTSDELYERGIIDVLTEPGEGVKELESYIKKHRNQRHGHIAMQKARLRTFPVSHQELRDISDIWVDAALGLSARDLKIMDRLVNRQTRLSMKTEISSVA